MTDNKKTIRRNERALRIAETIYTLIRLQHPDSPINHDPNLFEGIRFSIVTHLRDFERETE